MNKLKRVASQAAQFVQAMQLHYRRLPFAEIKLCSEQNDTSSNNKS